MLAFAHVLRALEHHVFKQMRESGVAGQFVPRADIVGNAQRNGWRRMVFREHHAQTVLQRVLLDGNLYFLAAAAAAARAGELRGAAAMHDGCDSQRQSKPGNSREFGNDSCCTPARHISHWPSILLQ